MQLLRFLLLISSFFILLSENTSAQNFDKRSNRLIQNALNELGYNAGEADGAWGKKTANAVRDYRWEFGLEDSYKLSIPEANALLEKSNLLNHTPGLVTFDNKINHQPSTSDETFSSIWYPPNYKEIIYGSRRHALAMMLSNSYTKFDYTEKTRQERKKQKIAQWLNSDITRLRREGFLLSIALVKIDTYLNGIQGEQNRSSLITYAVPQFRYLINETQKVDTPSNTYYHITNRLFYDFDRLLGLISCGPDELLDDSTLRLGEKILARYKQENPFNHHEIAAFHFSLSKCMPIEQARKHLTKRRDIAIQLTSDILEARALSDWAEIEFSFDNKEDATKLFKAAFKRLTQQQSVDLFERHSHILSDLKMKQVVEPFISRLIAKRSKEPRTNSAAMSHTRYLALNMMEMGFELSQIDPLFSSISSNEWLKTSNPLEYYPLVIQTFLDGDQNNEASIWAKKLIQRARVEKNLTAEEQFSAQLISALIQLGRLQEAEANIVTYGSRFSNEIANADMKITAWQTDLKLTQGESVSIGEEYVEKLLGILPLVCRDEPISGAWSDLPSIPRTSLYSDPTFLLAAKSGQLGRKLARCRGNRWVLEELDRLSCYIWAKLDQTASIDSRMSVWIQRVESNSHSVNLDLSCAMGLAEAGKLNFLKKYLEHSAKHPNSMLAQLLRLSFIDNGTEAAIELSKNWKFETDSIYDIDYVGIELAGKLNQIDRREKRDRGLSAYQTYNSGAGMDLREEARIRQAALDLGLGYLALNLTELALMYVEAGLYDVQRQISEEEASQLLFNEEKLQFILAGAKISLRRGDLDQALRYTRPFVDAAINFTINGKFGSVDELGQWSSRLTGFFKIYLSVLSKDKNLFDQSDKNSIVLAQQFIKAASSTSSVGRLSARLRSTEPQLTREYQDTLRDMRIILAKKNTDDTLDEITRLNNSVLTLRARLNEVDPYFANSSSQGLLSLDQIRKTAKGSAKIIITSLPEHIIITTILHDKANVRVFVLKQDEIASLVSNYRESILENNYKNTTKIGKQLSDIILTSLDHNSMPATIGIVVDGAFASLPFTALPISLDNGKTNHLGAVSAIAVASSVSALEFQTQIKQRSEASLPFIGFGDTIMSEEDSDRLIGFQPSSLRDTNPELRFMAATLGANPKTSLFLREEATETNLFRLSETGELAKYDILAFATHGFLENNQKIKEASLLMSVPRNSDDDGLLTSSEIYDLKLNARLVLLSACDTGAISTSNNELSDLTQAFQYAGAKGLIVTHWPIESGAAVEISRRLAVIMKRNIDISIAEAMRQVITSILADPNAERFHNPKHWASHAVIGLN